VILVEAGPKLQQAIAARESGDIAQAEQLCREALRLNPNDAGTCHLAGQIAAQAKQRVDAVLYLEAAAALSPGDEAILLDLAEAYEADGRTNDAWAFYEKATAIVPRSGRALGKSVGFLVRVEQNQGLLDLCRRAIGLGWHDIGTLL
jgi:tetratricopeptide (TPR) repeat protein